MSDAPQKTTVLVIDDQRFQRSVLARTLKSLGVDEVLEAADGGSALKLVRDHRESLTLIISDVDMPEMDGLEFIRRVAQEAAQTAVAIHSALDRGLLKSIEVMSAEYGLHLIGVLEKPATEIALRQLLESAMDRTRSGRRLEAPVDEAEIAAAIRHHEFEPWFQPKVELRTSRVCGAEVLVRWCRVHAAPLPPDRFLAAVTKAGLMRALTLGLAARSAQYLQRVAARGKGFTLSLNVCPTLLDDPAFGDALARALVDAGATSQEVVLEITENAAARNQAAALENLTRLRMRGFELSIDDFGTGFSSLAQLVRTPFSELKIDRTFVSRLVTDDATRALVEAVVGLARRLGLRTVAEGIETEAELEILLDLDCDMGQGYLFARPMPVNVWASWMQARQPTSSESATAPPTAAGAD